MTDRESMLSKIEKDMKVYDNKGAEVGEVEYIHFSEGSGAQTAIASVPDKPENQDVLGILGKLFTSDHLPEELQERLLMHGFIRVDSAKLFGADRYVMSDQIATVEKGGVYLNVDSEELVKR